MNGNKINSFTFYWDYFNLINTLPIEDKKELAIAILDYVFLDENPSLNGHNQAIFNTLSKQLDCSKNNSKRRTKKEPNEQPKNNRKKTKKEPNEQPKTNKTSVLSFKFYILSFKFNNTINNLIIEYLELRKKYKYSLSETIVKRLCNKLNEYGKTDEEKETIITNAINGAWKDFYPLENQKPNGKKEEKPEWFDKNILKQEASLEKQKEMKEILKEFQ